MRKFFKDLYREATGTTKPQLSRTGRLKLYIQELRVLLQNPKESKIPPSELPHLLNGIIRLLLEEEHELSNTSGTGPCIEFFLQDRTLEHLCGHAEKNTVPHIYQLSLNAISRILQHMKSPLIAHTSIYKPIVKLLMMKHNELMFDEKAELLRLTNCIAVKLKEAPVFMKLFWTGEYTIQGPKTESTRHFVLFKALNHMYQSGDDRRLLDQIRKAILTIMNMEDEYHELPSYLAGFGKFQIYTAAELGLLYGALVSSALGGNPTAALKEFTKHVQFCYSLSKINNKEFVTSFVDCMSNAFFSTVLLPSLQNSDLEQANLHLLYLRELLLQLEGSPLHQRLMEDILDPVSNCANQFIQNLTLADDTKMAVQLATNTLRLISTLLMFHNINTRVVQTFFFKNMSDYAPLETIPNIGVPLERIGYTFALLMKDVNTVDENIQDYFRHARKIHAEFKPALEQWFEPLPPDPVDTAPKKTFSIMPLIPSKMMKSSDEVPKSDVIVTSERPLISALFVLFENFFMNTLDMNLFLTYIFIKLARFPHKWIYYWMLQTHQGLHSLIDTIQALTNAAVPFTSSDTHLKAISRFLSDCNNDNVECVFENQDQEHLLGQNIVLLEEFSKELLGTLLSVGVILDSK